MTTIPQILAQHGATVRLVGLSQRYGSVAESIFEALPQHEASAVALALAEAIGAGANVDKVVDQFLIELLVDLEYKYWYAIGAVGHDAIDAIADLYRRRLDGDEPFPAEWIQAENAAIVAAKEAWGDRERRSIQVACAAIDARNSSGAAACAAHFDLNAGDSPASWQADTLIRLTRDALFERNAS